MEKGDEAAHQPKAGVHGQEGERGFGLSRFIQFREDTVQPEAALGIAITAFNSVSLTGVLVIWRVILASVSEDFLRPNGGPERRSLWLEWDTR